jgi:hypothetical protein
MFVLDTNWFPIVINMTDKYDYQAFVKLCEQADIKAMTFTAYAQRIDVLTTAISTYPELLPENAYDQLVADWGNSLSKPMNYDSAIHTTDGKPCCGGGEVR